jgi:hypothetical protein
MKTFPTRKWSRYPYASCSTNNHDVEKSQSRWYVQVNPSKKKAKGKDHFSKKRKRGNDNKGSCFQMGTRHFALIVVRVEIRLRSV